MKSQWNMLLKDSSIQLKFYNMIRNTTYCKCSACFASKNSHLSVSELHLSNLHFVFWFWITNVKTSLSHPWSNRKFIIKSYEFLQLFFLLFFSNLFSLYRYSFFFLIPYNISSCSMSDTTCQQGRVNRARGTCIRSIWTWIHPPLLIPPEILEDCTLVHLSTFLVKVQRFRASVLLVTWIPNVNTLMSLSPLDPLTSFSSVKDQEFQKYRFDPHLTTSCVSVILL